MADKRYEAEMCVRRQNHQTPLPTPRVILPVQNLMLPHL